MANSVLQVLKKHRHDTLEDEDGNELIIEFFDKASARELKQFAKEEGVELPASLKELYTLSNGLDFFGVEIAPVEALLYESDHNAFQFHGWGDGSFDYIGADGKIYFLDNSSRTLIPVAASLGDWMQQVAAEIKKRNVLMQPADYAGSNEDAGLYYPAYKAIEKKAGVKPKKKIASKPKPSKEQVAANVRAWDQIRKKFSDKGFTAMEDRIAKQHKGKVFRGNHIDSFVAMMREDFNHAEYSFDLMAAFASKNEIVITAFAKVYWPKKDDWEECVVGYTIRFALFLCYMKDGKEKELLSFLKKSYAQQAANEMKRIKRSYSAVKKNL